MRSAGGENDRIVQLEELGNRDIPADRNIATEIDAGAVRDLVVALADGLQRLMVGRDAETDQPVWHRVAIENVDPRLPAVSLFERLRRVVFCRPRTDHREMPHSASRHCERSEGVQPREGIAASLRSSQWRITCCDPRG